MELLTQLQTTFIALVTHELLVIAVCIRIIMRRPATGVAFAWMFFVALVPVVGVLAYAMIGERRLSPHRTRRLATLRHAHREIVERIADAETTRVDWSLNPPAAQMMDTLGRRLAGGATFAGSRLQLISDPLEILNRLADEIDNAKTSVIMVFFIWNGGGLADRVLEALEVAAARGVACRVLVDGIGSRSWLRGPQPKRLRIAGVHVRTALPVGVFRSFIGRTDLRLHRKIVVIDGQKAWTGSMNLVDPRFFKQDAGVGEWVDAMVEVTGTAVLPLAATAVGDWTVEAGEDAGEHISQLGLKSISPDGSADVQVIPSGPGQSGDALLQMLLALINAATSELIITTPYLVPDDNLRAALRGASGRGVRVRVIVPAEVDSFLTRHASRSYYESLMDTGVEFYLYDGGLLHTKSVMVDGRMAMFGTANIDMRSLWLNYEVSLFVFDEVFASELGRLQESYIEDSELLDADQWRKRSYPRKFLENAMRLASSVL